MLSGSRSESSSSERRNFSPGRILPRAMPLMSAMMHSTSVTWCSRSQLWKCASLGSSDMKRPDCGDIAASLPASRCPRQSRPIKQAVIAAVTLRHDLLVAGCICHYCEAMRHPLITLLATCLLAAAGAVGGWYLFAEPASNAREVAGPRARAVPVETALAEAGRAATRIRATGTLRASDAVVVQPEIAGRVTAILFEQGQAVAAGTPLITLAPETLQAELTKAEAALVAGAGELRALRGAVAARRHGRARRWTRRAPACARPRPRSSSPRCASADTVDHRPVRRRGRAEGDQRRPLRRARRRAGGAGADRSALPRFPPVRALADQAACPATRWR